MMPSAGDSSDNTAGVNHAPDVTVLYEKICSSLTNEDILNLRSAVNSINALSGRATIKDEPMDFDDAPETATHDNTDEPTDLNSLPNGTLTHQGPFPNPDLSNIRVKQEPMEEESVEDHPVENVAPTPAAPLAQVKQEIKSEPIDLAASTDGDVTHLWSSITGLLTNRSTEVDHALSVLQQSDVISRLSTPREQQQMDTKTGIIPRSSIPPGSRVAARSLPVFPPTYTSSFSTSRPKSPVLFDVGSIDIEPPNPPDSARRRRNRFADPVGPCLYDLYQASLQNLPVWPGEIVIPDDMRRATEDAQRPQGKREVAKHSGTAHIPSIFLDRVWSNVAIDLAPPTVQESVNAVRRLMRKRMHRCRYCGNRFVEIDIFERHIVEKHPDKLEKYRASKAKKEERERLRYLAFKARMKDIEDRRNQRLADQYEKTIEINRKREVLGLAPLEMEELFPPRPKRQRVLRSPSPEHENEDTDIANPDKPIKFKKRVCPQCPFCDKRYKNDMFLKKHIARKHPECIHYVQCNKCYKCVQNADALKAHFCDLTWICLECKPIRNMVTAARLMSHKNKFHRGEASGFKCLECERKFLTPRKLKTHKKLAHIHTRTYKCHFCDEHFIAEYQVSLHERIHTGKVKFECPICDFKCHRWVTLARHKKDDHGYLCMMCGERVMEWPELKRHTLEEHEGYLSVDSQTARGQMSFSSRANRILCRAEKYICPRT